MKTVLVTGANGFIGKAVCKHFLVNGYKVKGSVRCHSSDYDLPNIDLVETGELSGKQDWHPALKDVDIVVHLASTVHKNKLNEPDIYQRTIVDATKNLVEQANEHNIQRFIYISSASVYGLSDFDLPIAENTPKSPSSPYAKAKLAAENTVIKLSEHRAMQHVIIRPPLVYGLEAPGNFSKLVNLIRRTPFLPFAKANNKKSFLYVETLAEFIVHCAEDKGAANEVFNISDTVLSTKELCEHIAKVLDKRLVIFNFPTFIIYYALRLLGKSNVFSKLYGRMELDMTRAETMLNWDACINNSDNLKASIKNKVH